MTFITIKVDSSTVTIICTSAQARWTATLSSILQLKKIDPPRNEEEVAAAVKFYGFTDTSIQCYLHPDDYHILSISMGLVPPIEELPTPTTCVCPMRDIMSIGHHPGCKK
jgi:hypothetical protein